MSLNLELYRLIPLSGVGRVGPQPKVFALGTDETLAAAQATGYIDDLVNLKIPYANRELVPGDLIMLRYNIGGEAPNLPAWSLQQVTWTSDTYTLENALAGRTYVSGAAATAGIAMLVGGTVTISTTEVALDSVIHLNHGELNDSPALGILVKGAITPGVSFVIESRSPTSAGLESTDVSMISWEIVNPAS